MCLRYGKRTLISLLLIATLGLALRSIAVVDPVANPADDSHAYYALAKTLYEEGSYGGPRFENTSDWSPGAPWLYAGLFLITGGPREGSIRILEALMGVATIFIVFLLGWRLGGRGPALIAALGVAIYPPFIHSAGEIMSEPPAMLSLPAAILAFLWAWDRKTAWAWLLPGVLFGATAMFRPEYLLVAAAFLLLLAVRMWKMQGCRRAMMVTTIFISALVVLIAPWTIRNLVVLDRVVPISTGGGKALYVGTFLPADGEYQRVKAILYQRQMHHYLAPNSEALNAVNPTPLFNRVADHYPELPRDSALGKIGRQNFSKYFGEDPVSYLAMTARKVGRMWSSGPGEAMGSVAGRVVQILLVLLGLMGFVLLALRRCWWEAIVFAIPIVLVTAVGAVSLAAPRRNEVLMTLVMPLGGLALSTAGSAVLPEQIRRQLSAD